MKGSFKGILLASLCLVAGIIEVNAQCSSEGVFNFSRNAALLQSANNKTLKQNGVTLTITSRVMPTSTATLAALMFNDQHKPVGDTFTVHNQMNAGNPTDPGLLVKFVFDKPLNSLHFEIYDVDGAATKRDSIHVRGYNGPSVINLSAANYTLGSAVSNFGTNAFKANSSTGSGSDDPVGDVRINFPQPVDSITIVVSQGVGGSAGSMSVSFGNIRWCNDPPASCAATRGDFDFSALDNTNITNGQAITQDGVTLTLNRSAHLGSPTLSTWQFNDNHKTGRVAINGDQTTAPGTQVVKYKLAFNRRLQGLNLSLWDVDSGTGKRDSIRILAYDNGVSMTLDSSAFSHGRCMDNIPSGSQFRATTHGSQTSDRAGDLNVAFSGNVDSVIILTSQGQGGSGNHTFSIAGITWCNSLDAVPVFLKDFTGNANSGLVNLYWNTAGDKTIDKMEVQRSNDGTNFTTIGTVNGRSGFSNEYKFQDNIGNMNFAKIYYRILFNTTEGQQSFSSVLPIRFQDIGQGITIAPNPARNYAIIQYKAGSRGVAQVRLADATGRIVVRNQHNSQAGNNTVTLNNLDKLPEGIYTVMIESEGKVMIQKLSLRK